MKSRSRSGRRIAAVLAAAIAVLLLPLTVHAENEDVPVTENPPPYEETTPDVPLLEVPEEEPVYEEPVEEYSTAEGEEIGNTGTDEETTWTETGTTENETGEESYYSPETEYSEAYETEPETDYNYYYEPENEPEYSYYYETTDENEYYYTPSTDSRTDATDISNEAPVDTSEMTDDDWKKLQESLTSKPSNNNDDAKNFAAIKENRDDGNGKNDVWIYLALGIPLIFLGAGLIAAVVIINIRAKRAIDRISSHVAAGARKKKYAGAAAVDITDTFDNPSC